MGVAFDVEVTRSRAVVRWAAAATALGAGGLGLAAWQLWSGPTPGLDGSAVFRAVLAGLAGSGAAALLVECARLLRPSQATAAPGVRVHVDECGVLALTLPGGERRPMTLRAACGLPGLTLLVVAPYPAMPADRSRVRATALAVGRDGVSGEAWRRLHAWLCWIERGRTSP